MVLIEIPLLYKQVVWASNLSKSKTKILISCMVRNTRLIISMSCVDADSTVYSVSGLFLAKQEKWPNNLSLIIATRRMLFCKLELVMSLFFLLKEEIPVFHGCKSPSPTYILPRRWVSF